MTENTTGVGGNTRRSTDSARPSPSADPTATAWPTSSSWRPARTPNAAGSTIVNGGSKGHGDSERRGPRARNSSATMPVTLTDGSHWLGGAAPSTSTTTAARPDRRRTRQRGGRDPARRQYRLRQGRLRRHRAVPPREGIALGASPPKDDLRDDRVLLVEAGVARSPSGRRSPATPQAIVAYHDPASGRPTERGHRRARPTSSPTVRPAPDARARRRRHRAVSYTASRVSTSANPRVRICATPGTMPAIRQTRGASYDYARRDGVTVFFITGRPDMAPRDDDRLNLDIAPASGGDSTSRLRPRMSRRQRRRLEGADRRGVVARGYRIVANVGDE